MDPEFLDEFHKHQFQPSNNDFLVTSLHSIVLFV